MIGSLAFLTQRSPEDASSAMNFAQSADGTKRWSDVFAMAKALGDSAPLPRCSNGGLNGEITQGDVMNIWNVMGWLEQKYS